MLYQPINLNFNLQDLLEKSIFRTNFDQFNFDFLISENVECLGVDIMRLQDPRFAENDSKILEFFRIMKRQFTTEEWSQICSENAKLSDQAANFFRFWTLKESFVKAIGHGLGFNLQRLSFSAHSPLHSESFDQNLVQFSPIIVNCTVNSNSV